MAKTIKGRKFVATAATAALVASAIVPVASASTEFKDTSKISDWAAKAVDFLVAKEVLVGDEAGNFIPQGELTRGQAAKILALTLDLKVDLKASSTFADAKGHWSDAYIAAIVAHNKDIITGFEDGTFRADGKITREQFAKMVVEAFEIELDETKEVAAFTDVSEWATKYVQVLASQGIVTGLGGTKFGGTDTLTREQGAVFAHRTLVEDVREKVADKVVAVTTASKVESVTATNLKQVVVTFDGTVDAATATDKENYSIEGLAIQSASLSEDGKSVTLTLVGTFTNQVEYKLSFSNIKAGTKEITASQYKFTPVDAALPTVTNVTALGNQTLSVTFSEPIKSANASNFTIDGKVVVGDVKVSGKTVIVKLYTTLADGEYTVAVKDVTDYANFKSLNSEHKFTVVKDDTAPTLSSVVNATFEKVTIKFSEIVDPATVTTTSAYWLQGSSKKYPKAVTQISADTFEFDFSDNKIQYTTDLYVTGVKDYSSNVIAADSKIQVTPVIDQTRPEVSSLVYDAATKSFTVKFNKAADKATAEKAANYVVKNSAGTVVSKFKTATLNSANNKEVTVQLVDALTAGATYTVEVAGVSDNTTLKNVMLPYTKTITVGDASTPELSSVVKNLSNNSLVVNFSKKMAVSGDGSIVEKAKYFYKTTGGTWKTLPAGASVNVSPDGKSAIVYFPTSDVLVDTITDLRVQLVKDDKGNFLTNLTQDVAVSSQTAVTYNAAVATANNKVAVEFSRALLSNTVNVNDFTVKSGGTTLNVVSASLNATGTKVILTLADSNLLNDNASYGNNNGNVVTVDVRANATTSTVDGTAISAGSRSVTDGISATIKSVTSSPDGAGINITFNEALKPVVSNTTAEATDFIITDANGTVLAPGTGVDGYSVTVVADTAVITFGKLRTGVYSVAINPRFLTDVSGVNLVDAVSADDAIDVYVSDTLAPAAAVAVATPGLTTITGTAEVGATIKVYAAATGGTAITSTGTVTVAADGTYTWTAPTALAANTAYYVEVVDAAGNASTRTAVTTPAV